MWFVGNDNTRVHSSQLLTLCESDDAQLSKLPCYRSVPSLIPLKVRVEKVVITLDLHCVFYMEIHVYSTLA